MSRSRSNLPYVLLQLVFLQFLSRVIAVRKGVIFHENGRCRTTVQGRYLLSDDNGFVCHALSMDSQSRCCPERGEKFSCHGCNLLTQCCDSYEYCVSCCLNPTKTRIEHIMNVKVAKPATAAMYTNVFDYCAGRCRHSSESVVHENAYLSDYHHCFSLPSSFVGTNYTQIETRLLGINIIVGRQGESCDAACKSNGQSCVGNKMLLLNQCDVMQRYMNCKGGCLASMGADQPAEVADDGPSDLNPGACLYSRSQPMLSCDGSHPYTSRLCPCA